MTTPPSIMLKKNSKIVSKYLSISINCFVVTSRGESSEAGGGWSFLCKPKSKKAAGGRIRTQKMTWISGETKGSLEVSPICSLVVTNVFVFFVSKLLLRMAKEDHQDAKLRIFGYLDLDFPTSGFFFVNFGYDGIFNQKTNMQSFGRNADIS